MPSRTIALGEREISRVGLGTNRLTDTEENRDFLREAVASGLSFIDTAHLYTDGASESTIGAALSPFPDDVVVATKGAYHPGGGTEGLRAELAQSFERLRTETIDLYYLHRVDPDISIDEWMRALKEYLDDGRIAHVGLSEVSVEQIEHAREVVPISAVQNEYGLSERKHEEVIDHCEAEGIVFVPFFPLRGDKPALGEIAERHDATTDQIKTAWLLHRSPAMAPIPGTLSIEHLRENLAALEIELSEAELEALS